MPSAAAEEATTGLPIAIASSTLFWIPRASVSGATTTSAAASHGRVSGTSPVTITRSPASDLTDALGARPTIANTAFGNNLVMDYAQISITQCTDCRMLNNIIVAPENKPINRVNGNSKDILVSHNLFWGGDGLPFSNSPELLADPCFVNAAAGDFRPKLGSPALHAGGFFENLPIRYQDGGMRSVDSAPVIGALPTGN